MSKHKEEKIEEVKSYDITNLSRRLDEVVWSINHIDNKTHIFMVHSDLIMADELIINRVRDLLTIEKVKLEDEIRSAVCERSKNDQ